YFAGTTLAGQFNELRDVVQLQWQRLMGYAVQLDLMPAEGAGLNSFSQQLLGGVGRLTSAVGTAIGAITSMLMILVIGIFVAIEPKLYDKGVAWMLPVGNRARFYEISNKVGFTLRRLMFGR